MPFNKVSLILRKHFVLLCFYSSFFIISGIIIFRKMMLTILNTHWFTCQSWRFWIWVIILLRMMESSNWLCAFSFVWSLIAVFWWNDFITFRSLIPYFSEMSETQFSLVDLRLENCELTYDGVGQLLRTLSTWKKQLRALSVGENDLRRFVWISIWFL